MKSPVTALGGLFYVECDRCHRLVQGAQERCPTCLIELLPKSEPIVQALPVAPTAPAEAAPVVEVNDPDEGRDRPLFELVVRGHRRLDALLRDEAALPGAMPKLLALALLGLFVHGLVVGAAAEVLRDRTASTFLTAGHPALWMPLASMLAFVGALGICLPTFYFHTQLAGLDASFRIVTAQALRGQATTSVLLLGVLPFYTAWLLSCVLGLYSDADLVLFAGLCLPFAVGLLGVRAVYRAFTELARHLPITHPRRGNYLRRMVLAWSAVYTAVAPVALVRIGELLSGGL